MKKTLFISLLFSIVILSGCGKSNSQIETQTVDVVDSGSIESTSLGEETIPVSNQDVSVLDNVQTERKQADKPIPFSIQNMETFEITQEEFSALGLFDSTTLKQNFDECSYMHESIKKDSVYFSTIMKNYNQNDMAISYNIALPKSVPQEDRGMSDQYGANLLIIPNKLPYTDISKFKEDFSQCFAGGIHPFLITQDYLVFVNACGSGAGEARSCTEIKEIIEKTLSLK